MPPSPHILVAEDEDLVAVVLAEALQIFGCRVTVAHDGVQALAADEQDPADLLLTDMRMPVMDGNTLIRIMRQRRPGLPIVVLTGYSHSVPREEAGRLVVVRKPYEFSTLMQTVASLLPRS